MTQESLESLIDALALNSAANSLISHAIDGPSGKRVELIESVFSLLRLQRVQLQRLSVELD